MDEGLIRSHLARDLPCESADRGAGQGRDGTRALGRRPRFGGACRRSQCCGGGGGTGRCCQERPYETATAVAPVDLHARPSFPTLPVATCADRGCPATHPAPLPSSSPTAPVRTRDLRAAPSQALQAGYPVPAPPTLPFLVSGLGRKSGGPSMVHPRGPRRAPKGNTHTHHTHPHRPRSDGSRPSDGFPEVSTQGKVGRGDGRIPGQPPSPGSLPEL